MKPILKSLLLFFLTINLLAAHAQIMNTVSYRDTTLPRIDIHPAQYGFIYPIEKDFYKATTYTPPADGRFFVQNYGPRYIGNYDNHQGSDIWGHTVADGLLTINPPALCMCDGEVMVLTDGPDASIDLTTSGRTIRVECDSFSQVFNSPINIVFRHLDSIDVNLAEGMRVSKGDTLAFVGESGTTTLSHLHFDYTGIPNQWGNTTGRKYLNPNRLFDPNEHPHVVGKLDNAHIEVLQDWPDSSLIRIHWPHNQHINRFEFTNGNYNLVYDVEEVRASYAVFEPSIYARDSMKIFPYRTNGFRTASYYQTNNDYPAIFPNSPDRDTNLVTYGYAHIPLTADSVVNVYDFMLLDLPTAHNVADWFVKLTDVWGYTVAGDLSLLSTELTAFEIENQQEKQVRAHWATSAEINNAYFILERSKDGVQFEEVARIEGAGNSSIRNQYHYVDFSPYTGLSYYRLKQVDFDGQSAYSEIRSLYFRGTAGKIKIYPNPSADILSLELEDFRRTELLEVFDSSGKLLMTEKVSSRTHFIDISEFDIGVYCISFGGESIKFIKN